MSRTLDELSELIYQIEKEEKPLEAKKAAREKEIEAASAEMLKESEKKIAEFKQKLQELNDQKSAASVKPTKINAFGWCFFAICMFLGVVNTASLNIPYATIILFATGLIVRFIFVRNYCNKREKAQKALCDQLDNQINSITNLITEEEAKVIKIYDNDPQLSKIQEDLWTLYSRKSDLEQELKDAKLASKVGNNNLFVYADTENAYHRVYGRGNVTVNIIIDGTNKGMVAKPFSIVHLNEGIHSVSFELHFHSSGDILTMKEHQFSLKDNNRFFVLDNLICSASTSGCSVDKYDDFDNFIRKANLKQYEVEKYLNSL